MDTLLLDQESEGEKYLLKWHGDLFALKIMADSIYLQETLFKNKDWLITAKYIENPFNNQWATMKHIYFA